MPGIAAIGAVPGIGTQYDALGKRVLWTRDHLVLLPASKAIAGSQSSDVTNTTDVSVLQAGLLMGRNSTTGKYEPAIVGLTNAAVSAGTVTSLTVTAAVATEVARLIAVAGGNVNMTLIGPPTAAGTVASQSIVAEAASGTTITITSATLAASVTKSILALRTGSETPCAILVKEDGVPTADRSGTRYDVQATELAIGGCLLAAQICNYPADAALKAWIKAKLRAVGYAFVFDDDF